MAPCWSPPPLRRAAHFVALFLISVCPAGLWANDPLPGQLLGMLATNPVANQEHPQFEWSQTPPEWFYSGTDANQNVTRYWNYRNRLRSRFVLYNVDQGSCLPAERIQEAVQYIHWGDTTVKLGWYLGVLATEIHMLTHPAYAGFGGPNDLKNATNELFCALLALERLDVLGEQGMWESNWNRINHVLGTDLYQWPNTTGFFIRDDVTAEAMQRLNFSNGSSDFALDVGNVPFFLPPKRNKEMSTDQAVHLLLGLALCHKFLPASLSGLKSWAERKAQQIVNYMHKGHRVRIGTTIKVNGKPYPVDIGVLREPWILEEPVTPKINWYGPIAWFNPFRPVDPNHMDVIPRGGNALAFAVPLSLADLSISGQIPSGISLEDVVAGGIGGAFWATLGAAHLQFKALCLSVPDVCSGSFSDGVHMTMALAAISNGWGPLTPLDLYEMIALEDFDIYLLLNAVLYYDGHIVPPDVYLNVEHKLLRAPYGGPQRGGGNGWGSQNRFITDIASHDSPPRVVIEEYNGLDYMLLHNLYYIALPEKFTGVGYTDQPPLSAAQGLRSYLAQAASNSTPVSDRPQLIPELPAPAWLVDVENTSPPIGYGVQGWPQILSPCTGHTGVALPITVYFFDPGGATDKVKVELVAQPPDIGYVTLDSWNGSSQNFTLHGAFWGRWSWETTLQFRLTNEDGYSRTISVAISYPGAVPNPPLIGSVGYVSGVTVYGWLSGCFFGFCWNIPLFGTIDMQFSVYSIDCNCVPPQPTAWLITGLSGGVLAWPTGMSSMRAAAPWAIWDLLGHYGEIQLTAANPQGQLGHFNVPVWW